MHAAVTLAVLAAIGAPGADAQAAGAAAPGVEALVAGADACATRKLSQEQMADRLAAAGWTLAEARPAGKDMAIKSYTRQQVSLYYFTSKPMTQCVVTGRIATGYSPAPLVAALTARFGKQPRVDTPGRRYLYALPRLDILTLQIKSDATDPHVELSVVH